MWMSQSGGKPHPLDVADWTVLLALDVDEISVVLRACQDAINKASAEDCAILKQSRWHRHGPNTPPHALALPMCARPTQVCLE